MPCSFCNAICHTIKQCESPDINQIFERIKNHYYGSYHYILDRVHINDVAQPYFYNIITDKFQLKELRVVGVKYLSMIASKNKREYINTLWNYFEKEFFKLLVNDVTRDTYTNWLGQPSYQPIDVLKKCRLQHPRHEIIIALVDNRYLIRPPYLLIQQPIQQQPPPPIQQQPPIQFPLIKKYNISVILDTATDNEETECAICYENINHENKVTINCRHEFCGDCIKKTIVACKPTLSPVCALCREPMKIFDIQNKNTYNLVKKYCTNRYHTIRYKNSIA
jgi:hypothetical protein